MEPETSIESKVKRRKDDDEVDGNQVSKFKEEKTTES